MTTLVVVEIPEDAGCDLDVETGFQTGTLFSSQGQLRNFIRLSFAHYDEDDIRDGIARMRPLFE